VDHLQKTFDGAEDVALACVYFNYTETVTAAAIVSNLLKQLLERKPTLSQEAGELYKECYEKRETPASINEIFQLLHIEASRISSFFIVLDALDECTNEANTRAKIVLELEKIPNVRLMITGRKDVEDIVLSKCTDSTILRILATDDDMRRSIGSQVDEMLNLSTINHSRQSIVDKVVTKANGMYSTFHQVNSNKTRFLLASLYVELLAEQLKTHDILAALDQLPKGLEATYDVAVSRIHARHNKDHVKVALKTLTWITFAREPLEVDALRHALVVEEDSTDINESDLPDIQKVILLCVGLVAVDLEGGKIRLVHETTQQYFQKYFRDVQTGDGEAEIAKTCLRYFSFPAFCHPFWERESIQKHLEKYKLSSYASRYWFVHIRQGRLEEKFCQAIIKTFENQGTRDSVYQLLEYCIYGRYSAFPLRYEVHLLHLASMHGLRILCGEVLRQSNTMPRMYFLVLRPLILVKCPWRKCI
jgi:hypothetical protein